MKKKLQLIPKRIIRDYYIQLCNTLENLEEIGKVLETEFSKTEPGRNRKYEQTNHKH